MSIKGYIDELEQLKNEININNNKNKILRKRVKEIENNIKNYLDSKNQVGLKYNGKAIILENKEKRVRKKKKEKRTDLMKLLYNLGIKDTEYVYDKIIDCQKGNKVEDFKLKMKKIL